MNKKTQSRKKCDKLWFNRLIKSNCEVCGKNAHQVHHFFPKGQFGHLRYVLSNGVVLCNACHFAHHHKGNPIIHQTIIEKRGKKWYKSLLNTSREKPSSYQTIRYYNQVMEDLEELDFQEVADLL